MTQAHGPIIETEDNGKGIGRAVGLWLGIAAFLFTILFIDLDPENAMVTRMAAVAIVMAVWWISDAIPLAATAMMPLVLYPLLGIMSGRETAPIYVNYIIFLFVGGFMIAIAMEKWKLHKRIALWIIRGVGGGPSRLVLSFMVASAFLSMWISNTATAIMMLTIGLAIIAELEATFGRAKTKRLSLCLLLGIAYGASIGGTATLVGTPPNLSFVRIYEISFVNAPVISFGQWMLLGLPFSLIMLTLVWLILTRVFFRIDPAMSLPAETIRREYAALGPLRFAEGAVLAVFTTTALLWVFRKDLVIGPMTIPGWADLLPYKALIDDGTVAVTMALLLFLIPSRSNIASDSRTILTVDVFRKVPWHIVLLFGGGFALAKGFQVTGLSQFVGDQFAGLEGTPIPIMIAAVAGTLTFLTELTSNTATTEMVLPILASAGPAMGVHPLLVMIPATISASCAFMLPVATPPNAIIFGSGRVTVADMAKVGLAMNLLGVIMITLIFFIVGPPVFDIDLSVVPEWATH